MNYYISAILGITIVSLIPFLGLLVLVINKDKLEKYSHILVSFAVGALLGNSIIHLLPEVFRSNTQPIYLSISIMMGILLFYSIEQFLHWHHCRENRTTKDLHPMAYMNQIGDTVHNFIDGILIATSFAISIPIGWGTIFAVILHEIPQEIADFGILFYAKLPIKKIILVNIISACTAFLGLAIGFWLNKSFQGFANISLATTAGGFIYIACSDLIPDLHEKGADSGKERLFQLLIILMGAIIFLFV